MPAYPVFDVSFIPPRPVVHRTPALPSARQTARQLGLAPESVAVQGVYLTKGDVRLQHEQNTYPVRNPRCSFVTRSLDCIVGGDGHVGCLDEKFHERCDVKHRAHGLLERRSKAGN